MNNLMNVQGLWQELLGMLPAVVVAITALVVMVLIALKRNHFIVATASVVGLNIALITMIAQIMGWSDIGTASSVMFSFDGFAKVNGAVILIAALACCSLAYGYFESLNDNKEELYLLVLISTLGALLMVAAQHLAAFFVSLELLSVPMYGLLAYAFAKQQSLEAGLKYLILSAAASATLLMGMALVYAGTGSMAFAKIQEVLSISQANMPLVITGGVLMMVAIAFKLSLAPFHAWVGDVYEGAPLPMTAFLASVAKVAVMAVAIRFLIVTGVPALVAVDGVLVWLIVLSVLAGNLLALRQENLKRLFAYSSIAHMGYVLIMLVSIGAAADGLVSMYMAVYALSGLGVFGVMTVLTGVYRDESTPHHEASKIDDYRGLFWQRPILTAVMTVMLLSMAGIPLTAGFITKFQVMFSAVQGGRFGLAVMLVVGSAIGLYYYLRLLLVLFKRPEQSPNFAVQSNWAFKVDGIILVLITLIVLGLGVLPNGLFVLAGRAIIG
ncbi:MAG: NADH-quinone oxidoreductase subunit N [Moraxella sp.]|nr:NADH-quinone oxidoreductase subunit N [Moraxella sp.]